MQEIEIFKAKRKPTNLLAGAIDIAIKDAERFGTSLVIKGADGRIKEVSPSAMRKIIAKKK